VRALKREGLGKTGKGPYQKEKEEASPVIVFAMHIRETNKTNVEYQANIHGSNQV